MIRRITPELHALFLSHIPARYLRTDDHAPPGRPLKFADLGRPLNYREIYKIKKWRREGITEMVIKARIVNDGNTSE